MKCVAPELLEDFPFPAALLRFKRAAGVFDLHEDKHSRGIFV